MYCKAYYDSPMGKILIVCNETHLIGLWFEGQKYYMNTLDEAPVLNDSAPLVTKTKEWLDRYFNGEQPDNKEIQLAPRGGEFRQRVWELLRDIPYGEVMAYGEIAKQIAIDTGRQSMSAQAVGNAVAHNPVSIIIPCHRVVGTNGSLTGYAGGLDKKIQLLQLENVDTDIFFKPKKGTAL